MSPFARPTTWIFLALVLVTTLVGCGDNAVYALTPFLAGDPEGHADPLGATSHEARAGRLGAADIPQDSPELLTWREGDFVLANPGRKPFGVTNPIFVVP